MVKIEPVEKRRLNAASPSCFNLKLLQLLPPVKMAASVRVDAAADRRSCSLFLDGNILILRFMTGCQEPSTPGTQSATIEVKRSVVETKRHSGRDNEDHGLVLIMNEIISWARRPSWTVSPPRLFSPDGLITVLLKAAQHIYYLASSFLPSSVLFFFFLGSSFLFALRSCCTLHFPALWLNWTAVPSSSWSGFLCFLKRKCEIPEMFRKWLCI